MAIELLAQLVVYVLALAFVLGTSVAIGMFLHWLLPSVDTGMAILIGLFANIATAKFHSTVRMAKRMDEAL